MTVIARDGVAADHLVYCWPFPIGPECEVACSEEEQVVMCPAWMVGDRLGPGRHRWRTPDPTRPVSAFFVLTTAVEVSFDLITAFVIPQTGQGVRLRAAGTLQVRCADPGLLVAQFVGLPFDQINGGVVRSIRRSVERMLSRLLIRRVVMAGTPVAITDPTALPSIIEELVAYNPTAGAVFGVELIRFGYVNIVADDGSTPQLEIAAAVTADEIPTAPREPAGPKRKRAPTPRIEDHPAGPAEMLTPASIATPPASAAARQRASSPTAITAETAAQSSKVEIKLPPIEAGVRSASQSPQASGEIGGKTPARAATEPPAQVSGEIGGAKRGRETIASAAVPMPSPIPRRATPMVAATDEEVTTPSEVPKDKPPSVRAKSEADAVPSAEAAKRDSKPTPKLVETPSAILGIGMGAIGSADTAPTKKGTSVAVGGRVLVPGPNGLMQSATVRQAMQGYYELEIGSTGQTLWVPENGVVPD